MSGSGVTLLGYCDTLWLVLKVAKKSIRRYTVPLVGSPTDQKSPYWRALFQCSSFDALAGINGGAIGLCLAAECEAAHNLMRNVAHILVLCCMLHSCAPHFSEEEHQVCTALSDNNIHHKVALKCVHYCSINRLCGRVSKQNISMAAIFGLQMRVRIQILPEF